MSVFGSVQKSFIAGFLRKVLRITIINPENEPVNEKSYIVCSNHSSNWDPVVLGAATSRPLRYMAKSILFKIPILNLIVKMFGAYPVKRNTADITSIKTAINILNNGEIVGLYPPGKRAIRIPPDSKEIELKNGVGMIAMRAQTGVLPVSVITKGYKVKLFHKTIVVIGKFVPYEQIQSMTPGKTTEDYRNVTHQIYGVILDNYRKYDTLNK